MKLTVKHSLYILALLIVHACSSIEEDTIAPTHLSGRHEVHLVTTGQPMAIDLLNGINVPTATVQMMAEPLLGDLSHEQNGIVLYRPHYFSDWMSDFFSYKLCDDQGNCQIVAVSISFEDFESHGEFPSGELFPIEIFEIICQRGTWPDEVSINELTAINIDVLANDFFCYQSIDPTSLTIISQPDHGIAEVISEDQVAKIRYTNTSGISVEDHLIYQIKSTQGEIRYEYVSILVGFGGKGCMMTVEDHYTDDGTVVDEHGFFTMPVMANDTICLPGHANYMTLNTHQIENGILSISHDYTSVTFIPYNPDVERKGEFYYQIHQGSQISEPTKVTFDF